MSGKEILEKYSYEKLVPSKDGLTGKDVLVPRWGRDKVFMGGPWILHSVKEQECDVIDYALSFKREAAVIILSELLDPWGRPFVNKGIRINGFQWTEFQSGKVLDCAEYLYRTTVEGIFVNCGILVYNECMLGYRIIDQFNQWSCI